MTLTTDILALEMTPENEEAITHMKSMASKTVRSFISDPTVGVNGMFVAKFMSRSLAIAFVREFKLEGQVVSLEDIPQRHIDTLRGRESTGSSPALTPGMGTIRGH